MRVALRGASRFTFHRRRSRFFFGGFVACLVLLFVRVWLLCSFWLPRLRDPPSSFAQLNDRRSCHGAHGMRAVRDRTQAAWSKKKGHWSSCTRFHLALTFSRGYGLPVSSRSAMLLLIVAPRWTYPSRLLGFESRSSCWVLSGSLCCLCFVSVPLWLKAAVVVQTHS